MPKALDPFQSFRILAEVYNLVLDPLAVKGSVGSITLNARWFGVNDDDSLLDSGEDF